MSETKTYVFPESGGSGGGSGMMAMAKDAAYVVQDAIPVIVNV